MRVFEALSFMLIGIVISMCTQLMLEISVQVLLVSVPLACAAIMASRMVHELTL